MATETEEGPLLTITLRLAEQEAKALAELAARATRGGLDEPVRLAASDREARVMRRALAPLREALAEAGYAAG